MTKNYRNIYKEICDFPSESQNDLKCPAISRKKGHIPIEANRIVYNDIGLFP